MGDQAACCGYVPRRRLPQGAEDFPRAKLIHLETPALGRSQGDMNVEMQALF